MSSPTPTRRRNRPLRGLALGLVLILILFPSAWHLLAGTIQAIAGIVLGTIIAVGLHAVLSTRRH